MGALNEGWETLSPVEVDMRAKNTEWIPKEITDKERKAITEKQEILFLFSVEKTVEKFALSLLGTQPVQKFGLKSDDDRGTFEAHCCVFLIYFLEEYKKLECENLNSVLFLKLCR